MPCEKKKLILPSPAPGVPCIRQVARHPKGGAEPVRVCACVLLLLLHQVMFGYRRGPQNKNTQKTQKKDRGNILHHRMAPAQAVTTDPYERT